MRRVKGKSSDEVRDFWKKKKKRNNALKSYHEEKASGLADRLDGAVGQRWNYVTLHSPDMT